MSTQASDGPIKNRDVKRKAKIDGLKLDFYKATAQTSTTLAVYGHGADSGDPKGGGLWFDASANAWKATYNNGTIATLASSSTTGTLNDAYTNGASITITSAAPVVLGNAQTNGTASLDINLTGDQAGAANVSVIDIDVSAQTGSGTHAGVDVAFSTDGSGTPVGVLVAMNLAAQSAFTATKGSVTLTDGDLTLSAGNATITSDATTGTGLKVDGSTITSGDVLQVVCVSGTMGATGSAISVLDGSTEKFRVAEDGAVTIAGTAVGTAAETITAGDIVLTDGRIRATCTTDSTYANSAFAFDPSSITSGTGVYIDATSATTGIGLQIEVDASTMTTGKALDIYENDAATSIFSISDTGAVTQGSQSTHDTSAWTIGVGSITLSDGDLTVNGMVTITPQAGATEKALDINSNTAARTGSLITWDDSGTSSGATLCITLNGAGASGDVIDVDITAASSRNIITGAVGAVSYTGDFLNVDLGDSQTAAQLMVLDAGASARTTTAIALTDDGTSTGKTITLSRAGAASGDCIEVSIGNVAYTGTCLDINMGEASTVGATGIYIDASAAHTGQIINLDSSGVMYDNKGAIEIDHGTGVLVTGSSLLRVDSDAALTNAAALVNIEMSAGTAAYALWVEGGAVARTSSLVKIDDSGTSTGASLYVSSASAGAAKIAHIVASSASFTGSALYLDVGTASTHCNAIYIDATSAHNSDCVYITSTGVLANNKGVLNIEHAGVIANAGGAVVRIVEGAANSLQGSLLEVDTGTTATGVYGISVIGGAVARTSTLVNIADATTNGTGSSLAVSYAAATAANVVSVAVANVAFTGSALKLDVGGATTTGGTALTIDATSAHTVQTVNIDTSGVVADNKGVVEIDHSTGNITAGGSLLRVDSDSVISGAAALVNIEMSAATGAYALWVEGGAANRTSGLVRLDDAGTGSGPSIDLNHSAAGASTVVDIDVSGGIHTGNIIDVVFSDHAHTSTAINLDLGAASMVGGRAIAIDVTNAQTTDVIYINSTAVLAADKGILNIAHNGVLAHADASLIRLVNSAIQVRGALVEIDDAAASTAGNALAIKTTAATRNAGTTGANDVAIITNASAGSNNALYLYATGAGSGSLAYLKVANVAYTGAAMTIDIGEATTTGAKAISIDATNAGTDDVVYINTTGVLAASKGVINIAHNALLADTSANGVGVLRIAEGATNVLQGSLVNLSIGATATGINAEYLTAGGANRTSALVSWNDAGVGSGPVLDLNHTAAGASTVVDIDISGGIHTGNIVDITQSNHAHTGTSLAITQSSAAVASKAIAVSAGTGTTVDVVSITGTGINAADKAFLTIDNSGTMGNATSCLAYLHNTAIQTTGYGLFIQDVAASTGGTLLAVASTTGGAARTGNVVSFTDNSGGSAKLLALSHTGGTSGNVLDVSATSASYTGTAINIDIGTASLTGARALAIDATNAQVGDVCYINSTAVLANNKAVLNIEHNGVMANDGAAVIRVVNAALQNVGGALLELDDAGASTAGNVLRISASNAARTGDLVAITNTSTSSSDIISITQSGANSGCLVNCVVGAAAYTGNAISVDIGDTATACKGIFVDGGTGARTTALVDIVDAGTNAGHSLSITTSGTGAVHYGLYINATGAQAEALKVDAGAAVFDENVTITGTAILGANTIYVRSDAAGVLSLTTADAAPSESNQAQLRFLPRNVTDAGPMTATGGQESEIVYNLSDNKLYVCTTSHASAATWALIGGQTA